MAAIRLQSGITYGPILSRRLGRSLGINLLSTKRKICSFNCIYCQYGFAKVFPKADTYQDLPEVSEVLLAVEKALKKPRTIDYLTFSGNGEPTLHPGFYEIVKGVRALCDRLRPEVKLAVLTNASTVNDSGVCKAFTLLDSPMMKLDAGDEQTFLAINQPAQSVGFQEMVAGMKRVPHLVIQSMLIEEPISNVQGDPYRAWIHSLVGLKPKEINIYTTDRPTADDAVKGIKPHKLEAIGKHLVQVYALPVRAFYYEGY